MAMQTASAITDAVDASYPVLKALKPDPGFPSFSSKLVKTILTADATKLGAAADAGLDVFLSLPDSQISATTNAIKAASSFGDKIADLAGETAASRAVPEAFVAADVQHIVGLQRKLFAASVLLAGVYLFAEPLVRGFAALVGAACFGFVAAAVAGVKPPSLSKIKGPLHLLFPDQALFAPPKKDAIAPPSF